jgi:hypothetical protein
MLTCIGREWTQNYVNWYRYIGIEVCIHVRGIYGLEST